MQFNHRYFLDYCSQHLQPGGRALDFGCGKGAMVAHGRAQGLDVYGADIFYKDGSTRKEAEKTGFLGGVIKEIVDGKLNFPNGYFNLIVSNQVFEHINDLDSSLSEIKRVMGPGAELHTLFPVKETWWEGHFGVPFLHNFPSQSVFRLIYARIWRLLGLGYHHAGKSNREWAQYVCDWIDKYTVYRSRRNVLELLRKHFEYVSLDASHYLEYRLINSNFPFKQLILKLFQFSVIRELAKRMYFRRGGIVVTARRG